MNQFTYQFENTSSQLETYEWDNVWWEHADTTGVPRVLYIGDSISCATRIVANAAAQERIFFDGFGTSKSLDNPYFEASVRLFAAQQGERSAILFNNGLHGWHLDDATQYKTYYAQMVDFLLKTYPQTPLILLLTTHVADSERDKRVQVRNKAVLDIAQSRGLPVVDLYTITHDNAHLLSPDGVHLLTEGYQMLAEKILDAVNPFVFQ